MSQLDTYAVLVQEPHRGAHRPVPEGTRVHDVKQYRVGVVQEQIPVLCKARHAKAARDGCNVTRSVIGTPGYTWVHPWVRGRVHEKRKGF